MTARSDHRPASSSEGKGPPDFQRASRERRKGLWRVPCLHPPTRSPVAFAQRLSAFPIVLEIVPPHRRASEKTLAGLVTKVQDAVGSVPHLDALNIPEVLDENHAGLPFYRNLGPRAFAQRLNDGLRVEAIVNKVVVHVRGREDLATWFRESIEADGLRNFVLVGGTSSRIEYPGPDVVTANEVLGEGAGGRRDGVCGNITIPERPGEGGGPLPETPAGGPLFTTQVLFEPEPISTVLREY